MCSSLLPLPASRGPSQHTSPGAPELWDEEWDQCYGMGVKHPANDRGTPPLHSAVGEYKHQTTSSPTKLRWEIDHHSPPVLSPPTRCPLAPNVLWSGKHRVLHGMGHSTEPQRCTQAGTVTQTGQRDGTRDGMSH